MIHRRERKGRRVPMDENQLTEQVIGAAMEVHRALGSGILECTCELCLCRELSLRQIAFERRKPIPVEYKSVLLDCGYRADLVIDNRVLIELKAVETLLPIYDAQLITYLKLGGWNVGLIINFSVQLLKQGVRRRVLNFEEGIVL